MDFFTKIRLWVCVNLRGVWLNEFSFHWEIRNPNLDFPMAWIRSEAIWKVQSNLFSTDTKGTEPIVRFTEVSVL